MVEVTDNKFKFRNKLVLGLLFSDFACYDSMAVNDLLYFLNTYREERGLDIGRKLCHYQFHVI